MRRGLRVVKYLGLGLVVLLMLTAAAGVVAHERAPADDVPGLEVGEVAVAASARGVVDIGTDGARLVVEGTSVRIERAGEVVWASDPGHAFVTAARGSTDVTESRGYFWPAVTRETVWDEQSIEAVRVAGGAATITGSLAAKGERTAYEIVVRDTDGRLTMDVSVPGVDAVTLVSGRSEGAGVHGFGVQFTDFDLDGRVIPLLVREQGVGRGVQPLTFLANVTNRGAGGTDRMTYAAWPSFVTDDLRGVRVAPDSAGAHAFGVADTTTPTQVAVELWHPRMTVQLNAARTPAELVAAQQQGTDRSGVAQWTQGGLIAGLQGGTTEVRTRLARLQGAGVDVSGVWLQDWVGQRTTSFGDRLWWTWQLDRARYPEWDALVKDLQREGIRVTTYVNPFVVDPTAKQDKGIRNLYAEAKAANHLVKGADGQPYGLDQGGFTAYLVDLTNPAARDWFADVIAEDVLGIGVDGFMADFGEGLPFDAKLSSGDAAELHNAWPGLWEETVTEACRRAAKPFCVAWFRSGSLGTSPGLAWAGDQLVDFSAEDGLASSLLGTFSAGVSGWPVVHSDLGGYTSINAQVRDYVRTPELLERWAEVSAFGPVMRTHETNRPGENLQPDADPDVATHLARMTRVFAALADYRAEVMKEARGTGVPVMRHGWLVAPGSAAAQVDSQFFLGSDVLVAPVLEAGAETVSVTFPPGRWHHLFTGEVVDGGTAGTTTTVKAPIGVPAAYVSEASPWAERLVESFGSLRAEKGLVAALP